MPNCSQKGAIKNLLGNYGIKTERDEDDELYVFFDCSDLKLKQILSKSRFGSGDIKAVLKRVQYAERLNNRGHRDFFRGRAVTWGYKMVRGFGLRGYKRNTN